MLLAQVEETFRSLKTELGLRPIHHKLERRVRAHLFVTVLSYLAAHALRFRLRQACEFRSWSFLSAALRPMVSATCAARDKNSQRVFMRLNSEPNDDQRQVLRWLGMRSRRKLEWIVLLGNKM